MSDGDRDPYAFGRLVLEYLRVFMWPLIVLAVVLVYQDDVRKILSEREVDIFGLRIGKQVADIEQRALAEIADVRHLLEAQQAPGSANAGEIAQDIDTKLASLERNLNREIGRIQRTDEAVQRPSQATGGVGDRAQRAAAAERRGFEAILERNLDGALAAFGEAYRIWPDYRNVQEILRLLEKDKERLRAPADTAWTQLYRTILTRYSWGLPDDLRPRFRAETAAAY
jgi:hypothetical protein